MKILLMYTTPPNYLLTFDVRERTNSGQTLGSMKYEKSLNLSTLLLGAQLKCILRIVSNNDHKEDIETHMTILCFPHSIVDIAALVSRNYV